MLRTILSQSVLAGLLALLTYSQAHAYGCAHTGHTTYSSGGGVQHTGSTSGYGQYGSYSGSHSGSTTASGGTVTHTGSSESSGPGGSYSTSRYGSTTASGGSAYHSGSAEASGPYGSATEHSSSYRTYSPSVYGGYSAAGTTNAAYTRGVVRVYP